MTIIFTTSTNYSGLTREGVIWALNTIMEGTDKVVRDAELHTLRSTLIRERASMDTITLVNADMHASRRLGHQTGAGIQAESGLYGLSDY